MNITDEYVWRLAIASLFRFVIVQAYQIILFNKPHLVIYFVSSNDHEIITVSNNFIDVK